MKINKAVITAAGLGTRFLPAVKAYQKEMIPLMDKPQLQYIVEEAIEAGIEQIAIVTFDGVNTIHKYFSESDDVFWKRLKSVGKEYLMDDWCKIKSSCEITYFTQNLAHPYGNGTPFILAKDFIKNDTIYAMWGDDLFIKTDLNSTSVFHQLKEFFDKYNPVGVLAAYEVSNEIASKCGCYKYQVNSEIPFKVTDLIEKPDINELPSNFVNTSRFILNPQVFEELSKEIPGKNDEIWLTDAENRLIHEGKLFIAPIIKGHDWFQLGDPFGWLKANIEFARKDIRYKDKLEEYLSQIQK